VPFATARNPQLAGKDGNGGVNAGRNSIGEAPHPN